jgi:hypothetical protein
MHYIIIQLKNYKTFKTGEKLTVNKCNYKLTFSNILFEKFNKDVCLAEAFLGCGDSVNLQYG